MKLALVVGLALVGLTLASCRAPSLTIDDKDRSQQEAQLRQSRDQIGLPNIVNFTEKELATLLLELRDQQIPTYTYVSTPTGLHFLCNSIGYGVPYSTQVTNPEKVEDSSRHTGNNWGVVIPQAEPNGLFMPSSAEATWAICSGANKQLVPVYVEANLIISPFKLESTSSWAAKPSINGSFKVELSK